MELKDKQEILKAIKEPVPNNRIMSDEFDKYLNDLNSLLLDSEKFNNLPMGKRILNTDYFDSVNEKLDAMTDEEFIELMANALEDMEIAKMIEERKKNDNGKRYTMKDLDELFDRRRSEEYGNS